MADKFALSIRDLVKAWRDNFPVDDEGECVKQSRVFQSEKAMSDAESLVWRRIDEIKSVTGIQFGNMTFVTRLGYFDETGKAHFQDPDVPDVSGGWDAQPAYKRARDAASEIERHIREHGFGVALPSVILETLKHAAEVIESVSTYQKQRKQVREFKANQELEGTPSSEDSESRASEQANSQPKELKKKEESPDDATAVTEDFPELFKPNTSSWIKATEYETTISTSGVSLKTYRSKSNETSDDGTRGVDTYGQKWAKDEKGHVWYLKASCNRPKKS